MELWKQVYGKVNSPTLTQEINFDISSIHSMLASFDLRFPTFVSQEINFVSSNKLMEGLLLIYSIHSMLASFDLHFPILVSQEINFVISNKLMEGLLLIHYILASFDLHFSRSNFPLYLKRSTLIVPLHTTCLVFRK